MNAQHAEVPTIREAVGAFVDVDKVHEAIDELLAAGFHHEELGLLAGEKTVRQSLGEFYEQTNEFSQSDEAPTTAFVARESIGDTVHALIGTLFFAGSTVAAGAAVVSAAVLGGGILAAITGTAAIGAVGTVLGMIIRQSDAEELEQQVEEGHLLLFVRTRDRDRELKAVETLQKHTPIEVRLVDAHKAA
jgi:hypothetical protein